MNLKTAISGLMVALFCVCLAGCNWWGNDDDKNKPTPAPASGYEVTVYSNGQSQTVTAESYSVDGVKLSYKLKDGASSEANGTWLVKHNAWKSAASEKRYQATLYDGKTAVGSWGVRTFSTDQPSVLLFPADGSEVLRACGNLVIKTLEGSKSAPATARISLSGGDGASFSVEVSSYTQIGEHVQAEAADGSGTYFIWGKVKVESLN